MKFISSVTLHAIIYSCIYLDVVSNRWFFFMSTINGGICVNTIVQAQPAIPPPNNSCDNATHFVIGRDTINLIATDVTYTTAIETNWTNEICGINFVYPGSILWYTFIGTGETLIIQSCTSKSIIIYTGDCTFIRTCVLVTYDPCVSSKLVTGLGETYHLLAQVQGTTSNISVLVDPTTATNDVCINARNLAIGSPTNGYSALATNDIIVGRGACSGTYQRGLWYTFVGTGERLYFDEKFNPNQNRQTSIFIGGCDNMSCVATNFQSPNFTNSGIFSFDTIAGTIYHAVIQYSNGIINFGTAPSVPNDVCVNAEQIGANTIVDTTFATIESDMNATDDCILDQKPLYPGVWYTFVGTGRRMGTQICVLGSISIYTGGCSSITRTCAFATSDPCGFRQPFTFDTVAGETYHLLLQTMYSIKSGISIVDVPIVPNDFCINAESITISPNYITTDVRFATIDPESNDCGTTPVLPGVWYTFLGTGDPMTASVCALNTIRSIRIYTGGCDNSQRQCHNASMADDPTASACTVLTFDTKWRRRYYMLVSAQFSASINVSVKKEPICRIFCKIVVVLATVLCRWFCIFLPPASP